MKISVEREIAGRKLSLTTGEIAKQAAGAVLVQYGETVVLVAAQNGPGRPGIDFFPLTVDYRERTAAAGKFPGGFLKREGRPTTREILTARLTDRPIRPLFPDGYVEEVQIMSNVMAFDHVNDPDVLSIIGASAALSLAPVPFQGPIAAVRVGMVGDDFRLMPTAEEMETTTLDLIVAGSRTSVLMIEGFGQQIPEPVMADAIMFAHRAIVTLCEMQEELVQRSGKAPLPPHEPASNPFTAVLRELAYDKLRVAKQSPVKKERSTATKEIKAVLAVDLFPEGAETTPDGGTKAQFDAAFYELENRVVRDLLLEGKRLDGRAIGDLRNVTCEVGVLPRVHGSALFTRGETQSLATVVLGTVRDAQRVDGLYDEYSKRFMLDYNFPPYSVGECKPIRGPGRREIGHGALAERSVQWVLPSEEKFPYTIRVISDITESNGSSSMASVCSATLSLMDAGVPITQPVAGISIGLVKEPDRFTLLTDIMGDEDHFGDMDFKVAGTQRGITGIQLDLKARGLTQETIVESLALAKEARIEILRKMLSTTLKAPRPDISRYAPRILTIKINPEKIGRVIGPGGSGIRGLEASTGATIEISQDGTVMIACLDADGAQRARDAIEAITEEVKVGKVYSGKVIGTKDFGAFIEIIPGQDGLCHISELSDEYVRNVNEVCKIGDAMKVKVIAVDEQGRVKLSRKAVLLEEKEKAGDGRDR